MANKKTKLPIEALIKHLNEYKDAVVIIGPDVAEDITPFMITEETKEMYNRKNMVKKPGMFWQFYSNNIKTEESFCTASMESINKLLKLDLFSNVIDTNTFVTVSNAIHPNGINNDIECVKCHKHYNALDMDFNTDKQLKCECGGNLKPTVLYFGEKYNSLIYNKVKDAIFTEKNGKPALNTHTLFFIGVDFSDSLISEIIDSYDALKGPNDFTIIVTDKKSNADLYYYNPEFGVSDNIGDGINRLIKLLE